MASQYCVGANDTKELFLESSILSRGGLLSMTHEDTGIAKLRRVFEEKVE